ncbi:MAG: 50S ribosomal protein L11 methyltransferase [Candidatus Methylomirabilales bacterium]
MGEGYIEVGVLGTTETAEALADFLFSEGALGLVTEDPCEGRAGILIRASFPPASPVKQVVVRLVDYQRELEALGLAWGDGHIEVRTIPSEDWGKNWKQHFRPLPVGRRLVIAPPWEAGPFQEDRLVVRIDPGMSFGTGHHATTRMCLEALEAFLDQWRGDAGPRVLDVGTGTGVLAMAAGVLGAERVVAVDTDPEACAGAMKNLALNHTRDRVQVLQGGVEALGPGMQFDLVVANLDTKTLYPVLNTLKVLVAPQGRLVISGILIEEEEALNASVKASGLRVLTRQSDGEWLCFTLTPEAGDNRSAPPPGS